MLIGTHVRSIEELKAWQCGIIVDRLDQVAFLIVNCITL